MSYTSSSGPYNPQLAQAQQSSTPLPRNVSTPPLPPPKQSSGTPSNQYAGDAAPPIPPPPPSQSHRDSYYQQQQPLQDQSQIQWQGQQSTGPPPPRIEEAWLPEALKDKTFAELQALSPTVLEAFITAPSTTHPSYPASLSTLQDLLDQNAALAQQALSLSQSVTQQRSQTEAQLLRLHALERQWRQKESTLDNTLQPWSHRALHQRLVASIAEQEEYTRALEESFLEGDGKASEREVAEFVKRYREGRKLLWLRKERKERWDEGRVGGWR
ncbi:hypothetical protein MMC25_005150 [Agyrium rufum]|nr:hypothetical protein [Agyrium rufum]